MRCEACSRSIPQSSAVSDHEPCRVGSVSALAAVVATARWLRRLCYGGEGLPWTHRRAGGRLALEGGHAEGPPALAAAPTSPRRCLAREGCEGASFTSFAVGLTGS